MIENVETQIVHKFEQEYFPCAKEWWCFIGFFTTLEDNKKWSFKVDFYQIRVRSGNIGSFYSLTIFDLDNKKYYFYNSEVDSNKLETVKDNFFVKFDKSYVKGSYPNYQMNLVDNKNNLNLEFKFHADSLPYWVAQKITEGWLPWGLGYYRYGFIPNNDINGSFNINNKKFTIKGKGYFEHVWGDFSFFYLSPADRSIKKTISIYAKLIGRWIHNQDIKIPNSIAISTDNRPPGYDWFWSILDNGWSLFFGNMMFWLSKGPATGVLILSKDGKKYDEFSKIHFKYNKMKYLEKYDFFYPVELEIIAEKGLEKLYLHIKNTTDSFENIGDYKDKKNMLGLVVTQVPSKVDGYYINDNKKVIINGLSKLESHRLLKKSGHNSIEFNYNLCKNRFSFQSCLDSHYFGKNIVFNLQLLPKPSFDMKYNRINRIRLK